MDGVKYVEKGYAQGSALLILLSSRGSNTSRRDMPKDQLYSFVIFDRVKYFEKGYAQGSALFFCYLLFENMRECAALEDDEMMADVRTS